MAFESNVQTIGVFTCNDATSERFRFVKTVGTTVVDPDDGGAVLGVLLTDDPVVGQPVAVQVSGVAMCEASAAISADAAVEVGADGRIEAFSAGVKVGKALSAAAGAGSIIPVLLATSYTKA